MNTTGPQNSTSQKTELLLSSWNWLFIAWDSWTHQIGYWPLYSSLEMSVEYLLWFYCYILLLVGCLKTKIQDTFWILCKSNLTHLHFIIDKHTLVWYRGCHMFGQTLCDVSPTRKRPGCLDFCIGARLGVFLTTINNSCVGIINIITCSFWFRQRYDAVYHS